MIHRDTSPFAPLPGTRPAPRGLFVSLWGTLATPAGAGPARRFQEAEFTLGAVNALFRACQAGWLIYLLGNQPAVARGKVSEAEWHELERAILAHLAEHGVRVERTYFCIDDPVGGVRGRRKDSVYRLPNTGPFYHAVHTDRIELRRSWVLGDTTEVLVAGWRAGLRMVGLRSGAGLADAAFEVTPDFHAADLREAVTELLQLDGALHP
jgi:D-glycero-D-manno-heptose 1,7-bisphosphate phosphatase